MRACRFIVHTLVLAATFMAQAEEKPASKDGRLAVTVYYSKEDERWPAVEQAITAAIEPYQKIIQFEKVSIDTKAGYARMVQAEKELDINPGDRAEIMAVVGRFALINKDERRTDIQNHLARVLERMLIQSDMKKRRKTDLEAFAKEIFGEKITAKEFYKNESRTYYRVEEDGKLKGFVADIYHVIWCPVCADAQFALAVNESLKVKELRPVHELEVWGQVIEAERADKFLGQFKGRDPEKKVKTLDTISGATKTSFAYDQGVTTALAELKQHAPSKVGEGHGKTADRDKDKDRE